MTARSRAVWVVEVRGVPQTAFPERYQAEAALSMFERGVGRIVRYAPSAASERARTRQHARAAKKAGRK